MDAVRLLLRPRPLAAGLAGTAMTTLVIGILTVLIPNPLFRRMTPVRSMDYVFWVITALLIGLITATLAVPATGVSCETRTAGGGLLTVLAVGCPICNKAAVFLLGISGALNVFAPLQPLIGLAAVALLVWTLRLRLRAVAPSPLLSVPA